jgi:hypothetical protein
MPSIHARIAFVIHAPAALFGVETPWYTPCRIEGRIRRGRGGRENRGAGDGESA